MCSNKPATTWFTFNGDAMLIIKPASNTTSKQIIKASPVPSDIQVLSTHKINATVISGSIVAGPEAEYPRTLWSGSFPLNISLPVFWNSEDSNDGNIPQEDILHAHGVIWSGYQLGPRVEGSFSLPQYTKSGVTWWTGRFTFLFQTSWGKLEDLSGLIMPGINYNSNIIFRDIHSPTPLLIPSQFDIDTSTAMPIILLGSYSSTNKLFYWSGRVIIGVNNKPWTFVTKSPYLQLGNDSPSNKLPLKPKQRVGVLVSAGSLTNKTDGNLLPLWSGKFPVTIPLSNFNVTKGVNVIWTPSTLFPKFSGNFSIPTFVKDAENFEIQWMDGTFSFDLSPLWNTSLDVIELGKQYATMVSTSISKPTKSEQVDMYNSFLNLIMESKILAGSGIGHLNLKGSLTPDNMFFNWPGEAWYYANNTSSLVNKQMLLSETGGSLHANQFGGAVFDGSVTTGTSSFFSFLHKVWSGGLPVEIPFSAFWSGSFTGNVKFTRGVTWTASSITGSVIAGSYSVPQYSWDGITTTVTWYKGDFKFYVRPLWNTTLTSMIQPGTKYYSSINFQGEPTPLFESLQAGEPDIPGIRVPIILQGTYSPDRTSFFWSGNFILNVKDSYMV